MERITKIVDDLKSAGITGTIGVMFWYRGVPHSIKVQPIDDHPDIGTIEVQIGKMMHYLCFDEKNPFEKCCAELLQWLDESKKLEACKTRLIELVRRVGHSAIIDGDAVKFTGSKTVIDFNFRVSRGDYYGMIQLPGKQIIWNLAEGCEYAMRAVVDNVVAGSSMLYEYATALDVTIPTKMQMAAEKLRELLIGCDKPCRVTNLKGIWSVVCLDVVFRLNIEIVGGELGCCISAGHNDDYCWTFAKGDYERAACLAIDRRLGTELFEDYERRIYGVVSAESAGRAARWWADALRGKNPVQVPDYIEKMGGGRVAPMQAIARSTLGERVDRFEKLLAARLCGMTILPDGIKLYVDYHPEGVLADCWRASSIDSIEKLFIFPLKTCMRITKDQIYVMGIKGVDELI